ncbi:GAF domain-containing protein [Lacimicrobium sp. SS2-24]|uniref:GAF domain-containing protein n=1 Tax=Lacimicrobium sp. SS2-24 TaxID=2005569 RepID=UPI000B4A8F4D|nr:GAF domain-containing protein [Lacimicrobium sp. SS2-24]
MLTHSPLSASLLTKQQLLLVIAAQTDIIRKHLDAQGAMERMAELATELTFASGAVVEMVEGDEMVYVAATGKARENIGLRLKAAASLSGLCIKKGQVLNCKDSDNDSRVDAEACKKVGLRSMLVVPLRTDGALVGVLKVFSSKTEAFDDVDVQVLELVASIISAAIASDSTE